MCISQPDAPPIPKNSTPDVIKNNKRNAKRWYLEGESPMAQEDGPKQQSESDKKRRTESRLGPLRNGERERANGTVVHSNLFSGMMTCHGPITSTSP